VSACGKMYLQGCRRYGVYPTGGTSGFDGGRVCTLVRGVDPRFTMALDRHYVLRVGPTVRFDDLGAFLESVWGVAEYTVTFWDATKALMDGDCRVSIALHTSQCGLLYVDYQPSVMAIRRILEVRVYQTGTLLYISQLGQYDTVRDLEALVSSQWQPPSAGVFPMAFKFGCSELPPRDRAWTKHQAVWPLVAALKFPVVTAFPMYRKAAVVDALSSRCVDVEEVAVMVTLRCGNPLLPDVVSQRTLAVPSTPLSDFRAVFMDMFKVGPSYTKRLVMTYKGTRLDDRLRVRDCVELMADVTEAARARDERLAVEMSRDVARAGAGSGFGSSRTASASEAELPFSVDMFYPFCMYSRR